MRGLNTVLIGYGEIGKALYKNIKKYIDVVHVVDTGLKMDEARLNKYDYMLVTIPVHYSGNVELQAFKDTVKDYKNKYNPKCIIVFSTVPIGTCESLGVAHAPIEGRHPKLQSSIRTWEFTVGYDSTDDIYDYAYFFKIIRKKINIVPTRVSEFCKLQSTLLYGINIEFARWCSEMCNILKMNYKTIKQYNKNYNTLYKNLCQYNFKRYILDPPEGAIGGHCITPNARLLEDTHPNYYSKHLLEVESCYTD